MAKRSGRRKPVGWRDHSNEHALASKGIKTRHKMKGYGKERQLKDRMKVPFDRYSWDSGHGPLSDEFMDKYGLEDVSWDVSKQSVLESGYGIQGVYKDNEGKLWYADYIAHMDDCRIWEVKGDEEWLKPKFKSKGQYRNTFTRQDELKFEIEQALKRGDKKRYHELVDELHEGKKR